MTAPTLEGRLLCASGAAYAAVSDGPLAVDSTDTFLAGAGFLDPPTALVGGRSLIDACIVGSTADGVVAAFRGTLPLDFHRPPSLVDWHNNFNARPVTSPDFPGEVHGGFLSSLAGLWDRLLAEVQRRRGAATVPIFLTGHSKGGAMAVLAAWRLKARGFPVRAITFAAPKPGSKAFAAACTGVLDHVRYEYADDIVPHLPASVGGFIDTLASLPLIGGRFSRLDRFDYEPTGALRFIDWSNNIGADTPTLAVERRLSLVRLVARQRFQQIASDHSIACGSGYMSAICPEGVCPPIDG